MQSSTVMAFRKRMKSHGYTDISIYKVRPFHGFYRVRAIEPLAQTVVTVWMNAAEMHNAFRF